MVEPEQHAVAQPDQPLPEPLQKVNEDILSDASLQRLDDTSRQRLDQFLGLIQAELGEDPNLDRLAPRLTRLVLQIARRSAYLALLNETPGARTLLYRVLAASGWIADQLIQMPALLDELLDPRALFETPSPEAIDQALALRLARVDDLEVQLNVLREFKAANTLRAAATELLGERAINVASDHLSWTAEAILEAACQLADRQVQARHGKPVELTGGIAVIGYGKLGGLELSYGSDLDLVLIHGIDEQAMTDGEKAISGQQYLQRWVRHFMQILSVRTTSGVLYEIDMRLRPSGNKGVLVVSANGYRRYLESEAWTWERQALVRARFVAGDTQLEAEFDQIRSDILTKQRDANALQIDVLNMREKMRAHLASKDPEALDIKHGQGCG